MTTSAPRAARTAAQLREAAREVARLAARRGCPLPASGAWQSSLELGTLAGSVPCARLHARQTLCEWRLSNVTDAELLVSELVTNSVEAAQSAEVPQSIWLRLSARQPGLLIEVWDANTCPPAPPEPEDGIPALNEEGGRGLFLVGALSRAWGWYPTRTPDGKVTWCELDASL